MRQVFIFLLLVAIQCSYGQKALKFQYPYKNLGEVKVGSSHIVEFICQLNESSKIKITSVKGSSANLKNCSFNDYGSQATQKLKYSIRATLKADEQGFNKYYLVICTDSLTTDTAWISYYGVTHVKHVFFDKDTLDAGELQFNESKTMDVKFTFEKKKYDVLLYESKNDTAEIKLYTIEKDGPKKPVFNGYFSYSTFSGNQDTFAYVSLTIRNLEGNRGECIKKVPIRYSYDDSVFLYVKVKFIDKMPFRINKVDRGGFGYTVSFYKKGVLDSVEFYTAYKKKYKIMYYKNFEFKMQELIFDPKAKIKFLNTEYDYGKLHIGDNGDCEFWFENVGDEPLMVTDVRSSCGCLVPIWSKEPVMPGAKACIKGKYDTKRIGPFSKTLTANFSTGDMQVFKLEGAVYASFTGLQLERKEINAGNIPFGKDTTILVNYYNKSNTPFSIVMQSNTSGADDKIELRCVLKSNLNQSKPDNFELTEDKGLLEIYIRNVKGIPGKFEKEFTIDGNIDPVKIKLQFTFTGKPDIDSLIFKGEYEHSYDVFHYKNGSLEKIVMWMKKNKGEGKANPYRVRYFKDGQETKAEWINN